MKRALITGISGQDGAYLARSLLEKGYEVHGSSRDSEGTSLWRLDYLGLRDKVSVHSMAVSDLASILTLLRLVRPQEIYHLAGQSSVSLSFEQPFGTLTSNILGTLNLLEALRFLNADIRLYHAASSEGFGDTGGRPANIATPFNPKSPYAVSKASAFWEVANYRNAYGIFACSGVLFNHESPLRGPRFVTKKVISTACRIAAGSDETLRLGNIEVRRDWGWTPEYVEAMWKMLRQDTPRDFVICTGVESSLSDFIRTAFDCVGLDWKRHVRIDRGLLRPSDIFTSVGDPEQAERELGWKAKYSMPDVVRKLVEAEQEVHSDEI